MSKRLLTRVSEKGYRQYWDPQTERWVDTHRRVAEKKFGTVPLGNHIHHINGNKQDNRPQNLLSVTPGVHAIMHGRDPNACARCGRSGHWANRCYARTDYAGRWLD